MALSIFAIAVFKETVTPAPAAAALAPFCDDGGFFIGPRRRYAFASFLNSLHAWGWEKPRIPANTTLQLF
jgi:hypothetical protein